MDSDFIKFVAESTLLHEKALTEQIKLSEDANKYSNWFLGIASAGIAVLIARFDITIQQTWIAECFSPFVLIITGLVFLVSLLLGTLHHYLSMQEISQLRVLMTLFGAQRLLPFFNHPDYPNPEQIPLDMHNRISKGELLNQSQLEKFHSCQSKAKLYRKWQGKALFYQQIFSGIGYITLFSISVHL